MENTQTAGTASSRTSLSPTELAAFCAQIAMILKSGIGISEGISIMLEDTKNPQGRIILTAVLGQVEAGRPLYQALEDTGSFPKYVVDMTEIGETTGRLDDVMDSLSAYYEREEAVARNIKNAVTYPLIMIGMMLLVIAVLLVKVMPIFNQVYRQLGSEMTGFSQGVLHLGAVVGQYAFVILGVLAVLVFGYILLRVTADGKRALARFRSGFFLTRKFYADIASGRFASAMAMALSSGLDVDQALDMVYRLVDNEYFQGKLDACRDYMKQGLTFSDALVKAEVFSGVYARMVTVGFKTGSVDVVMAKLAQRYEQEVDNRMNSVISILEPTLVAVLSIIVGLVLLSVMLPLMGIMSSIG
ncbi:type II secretion system F family protein [Oscillospiraceae bacterium MB08-C2-2]|nr:type II secretion system F family protein [Oscillospiraceae bacterium MB08-C2-2]